MARYLLLGLLLCSTTILFGQQSRNKLEKERNEILNQISLTTKLLKETSKDKKARLSTYKTLIRKIEYREELIENYNKEISTNARQIQKNNDEILRLNNKLDKARADLLKLIRNGYRNKLLNNPVFFIFSAESLNNLFLRWTYLKKVLDFKKKQTAIILKTQGDISAQQDILNKNINSKKELLGKLEEEKNKYREESQQEKELISKLRKEEKSIEKDLKANRKKHEVLNNEIEKLIREEMAKAVREERKNRKSKAKSTSKASSDSFAKNKGRLPWPVKEGVITSKFGIQPHATVSGVSEEKKGIGISTEKNTPVLAIADGTVSAYVFIPGKNYMVLIKHGEYFSVYSQIENIEVKENQKIKAGTQIGTVARDPGSDSYELFFQIYKNKTRLNPSKWIKKRP